MRSFGRLSGQELRAALKQELEKRRRREGQDWPDLDGCFFSFRPSLANEEQNVYSRT
jgi:hypothetical protein